MPVLPLADLPAGCTTFLDTNVLVYGVDGRSRQCASLLERCSRREIFGVTLFEVVNEATHRFMLIEAVEQGLIVTPSAKSLNRKSHLVASLKDYWFRTDSILDMDLLFLAADEALLRRAQVERSSYGLLTNDSLIIACMRRYGISFLSSNDSDFGNISGITVFRPDDLG